MDDANTQESEETPKFIEIDFIDLEQVVSNRKLFLERLKNMQIASNWEIREE